MNFRLLGILFFLSSFTLLSAKNCFTCIKNGEGDWILPNGEPCPNLIQTAVPFLRIAPDARSAGMGDMGIATSPDAAAMHYNAAKLTFMEEDLGFQATYTPWLRALNLDDVFLAQLVGNRKLDENQSIGLELKYFSLGTIQYTDNTGNPTNQGRPNEFSLAAAYSRKLSKNLGVAVTGKFIYSNLAAGQIVNGIEITAGTAGAVDLSVYYDKEMGSKTNPSRLRLGAAITNLGNKISYSNSVEREFIPTNLGIGVNYEYQIDQYNKISFGVDFNKLLVPTPPLDSIEIANYDPPGTIAGMLQSFGDAPNGFSEEMQEIYISTGLEYWYDNQFAVRAGYFHETSAKGDRRFMTVGVGLKYNVFGLNFSYLIPTNMQQSALNNTLRFSLIFDLSSTTNAEDI
ncbi:MAG TPA: type IX secretion system outer membrane channel protein PorV [Saprospiraceae bacterium]|nr:type IX secretion system outer membrane channel protein PorV [Saprospiraceae bacterium]